MFLISSLSLTELVPLSFISHLSFTFKACIEAGLGSWFNLGMVMGWDRGSDGFESKLRWL